MAMRMIQQIATSSDSMLREQYAHLRNQIPLMYALMFVNAVLLGAATFRDVPFAYSVGLPALLCALVIMRLTVWLSRRHYEPTPEQIRRYLYGAVIAAGLLSAAFGAWGLSLMEEVAPVRGTAIALYVFIGAISACYCLQALPMAGWLVLLCGAMPITFRLLVARDWYLTGIGIIFFLATCVIIRTMSKSFAAFQEVVNSRFETGALVSALKASEERHRLASTASNDVIWEVLLEEDRIEWAGMAAEVFGYDGLSGGTSRRWWIERLDPAERPAILRQLKRLQYARENQLMLEFRFRVADGSYLDLIARGAVIRDGEGQPIRLIGTMRDVTTRRRYEDQLRRAAHYDSLTQLPNRVLFAERLEIALRDAREDHRHVGIVVFDVDRFKVVNDSLGHDAGDALLCEIALRLAAAAPSLATVARLGGDEFAIILPDLDGPDTAEAYIAELFARVAGPLSYRGRQIDVSVSAGSALAIGDGQSSEDLRKSADLALYTAKKSGLGQLCGFRGNMRDAAARHTQMLSDARSALHDNRVVPFYQPKICLDSGACVGFEALLRWHDHQGLQPPARIQAAFDDPGLSVQLTDHMLDRVIADMLEWREQGVAFHSIAINGSAGDFMRGDFAERILSRLHRANLPPSSIELEVTETVFLGQLTDIVSAALDTLSIEGVKIALDDFGTGYASLTHLKQFPVNALKIDRSFVSMLAERETHDAAIVGAIIDLARNMSICTVAEGIETPGQLRQLLEKGCNIGQGYLFGRPMAANHVAKATTSWNKGAIAALCDASDWGTVAREVQQGKFTNRNSGIPERLRLQSE